MRAVISVPQQFLDERTQLGIDLFDECWEGVLHMVPPPSGWHQELGSELLAFLKPKLARRGIKMLYETGVFRPGSDGKDYRVPDLLFYDASDPSLLTRRGIEGAPIAVLEIRSPDDETYEKFDFWIALGVREVIVIEPTARTVEIHRLASGQLVPVSAGADGILEATSLAVRWQTVAGKLRVTCDGEQLDI